VSVVEGCRFRKSCDFYSKYGVACNSFFERDFLRCREFRVKENKEAVFNARKQRK